MDFYNLIAVTDSNSLQRTNHGIVSCKVEANQAHKIIVSEVSRFIRKLYHVSFYCSRIYCNWNRLFSLEHL